MQQFAVHDHAVGDAGYARVRSKGTHDAVDLRQRGALNAYAQSQTSHVTRQPLVLVEQLMSRRLITVPVQATLAQGMAPRIRVNADAFYGEENRGTLLSAAPTVLAPPTASPPGTGARVGVQLRF